MKLLAVCLSFVLLIPALACAQPGSIDLAGVPVVTGARPHPLETLAARELQRYLYRITGMLPRVQSRAPATGAAVLVGTPQSHAEIGALVRGKRVSVSAEALGPEGIVLKAIPGRRARVVVTASTPQGVLWAAYALLERLGVGFFLGGDAFAGAGPARVPANLDVIQRPAFAVRGSLPWYNFLDSPTTWDRDDYRFFFDQMAKMRMNFVGFHSYDHEPFCAYEWDGKLVGGEPAATAHNYGWGTVRGMSTTEFGFGTGDFFFGPEFGSRATTEMKDRDDGIRRAQALLADALHYARGRGLKVCVGFEVTGDPTSPDAQEHLAARLAALVRAYPLLDYVWMWQSEGLGGGGATAVRDSQLDLWVQRYGKEFEYLGDPRRVHEAVRVMAYMRLAHDLLERLAPHVRMVVSGWGGDRWMRFSDFYRGLDRTLPRDVIFAALDNIDPSWAPTVSEVYGQLSPEREKWPIPWWESDGGGTRRDQWGPQCNTKPYTALCLDALKKGCQGLLSIHWRTRDVEEAAAYMARFAWDTSLTYERFYDDFARRCYGNEWASEMSAIHRELEALGPRYTGALGQVECGGFEWFSDGKLPSPENLQRLAELRNRLERVRIAMLGRRNLAGLERINWLATTIDWLTRYDAAALVLRPGGEVDRLLLQAEEAKAQGDAARSRTLADQAAARFRSCGLDRALQTYPWKMSTCGEWGTLATINVKAYAAYERIAARIRAAGGDPGEDPRTLPPATSPRIVMRIPPSIVEPGQPVAVQAIVVGRSPTVRLHYRRPGGAWHAVPMRNTYRRAWSGTIPGTAVSCDGIEYFIEARDAGGPATYAPTGYPAVTWSATVHSLPRGPRAMPPRPPAAGPVRELSAVAAPDYEVCLSWKPPYPGAPCLVTRQSEGEADMTVRTRLGEYVDVRVVAGRTYRYRVAPILPDGKPGPASEVSVNVPRQAPPPAPEGLAAKPGAGKVLLTWKPVPGKVRGYRVFRSTAPDGVGEPVTPEAVPEESLLDVRLEPGTQYYYRVVAVDRGGQAGEASDAVAARPLPRPTGPVFHAAMEGTGDAGGVAAQRAGAVRFSPGVVGQALDTTGGGYLVYPHQPAFELDGEFGIEFWFKANTLDGMPVLASCGEFQKNGWFVQAFIGGIRFSLGGDNILDAGRLEPGRWYHVACTYDLQRMRVYLDGREVGSKEALRVDFTPWTGPMFLGQYHFLQGPYQFRGLIDEVKLYHTAPTPEEVARAFAAGKG